MSEHDEQQSDPLPPIDDLDTAFELPETVTGPMRTLYESLVARMRRESDGIPMSTVQLLLIERIAYNYVVLKTREQHPLRHAQGFRNALEQQQWNAFWLSLTSEFNRQLKTYSGEDRDLTVRQLVELFTQALKAEIPSEVTRRAIANRLFDSMTEVGLIR